MPMWSRESLAGTGSAWRGRHNAVGVDACDAELRADFDPGVIALRLGQVGVDARQICVRARHVLKERALCNGSTVEQLFGL
jgi:hypothetical protein